LDTISVFWVSLATGLVLSAGGVLNLASFEDIFHLDATWQGLMSGTLYKDVD